MLIATYSIMLCINNLCFNTIELVFITRTCITVYLHGFIKRRSFFRRVFPRWMSGYSCIVYNPAIPGQPKRLLVSKIIDYLLDNLCYN